MPIFQKSVLSKYIKNLDHEQVGLAYTKFQRFYGDKLRLYNIMQLKEENYQEGFLREVFVQTLGYTINPDKDYNLTTEFKNQTDSRKADGAILKDGKAIGVIELKSTKTKDLESIKEQAFGYKVNQPDCKYVITSNFQSLRFYVDNATEYEEFNLFELSESDFKILYLLLSKESILGDIAGKIKQETKFREQDITERLYKDYQAFKDRIFENLVAGNPQYDKLTLFKKSQKLLDRFLFIFFAEDCGLIPPNAISKIIEQWKMFVENDEKVTLYSRFQKLFVHLNQGYTYANWGEIPAYNGGLFRFDHILDQPDLKLPDGILQKHTLILSAYDFSSEVDVNILGHIFEHSLNEMEEMERNLTGLDDLLSQKSVSKRKKDGIFYTPKYITQYIVENTVGLLCANQKAELQIAGLLIDDTYRSKSNKLNKKGKELFEVLQSYKTWLLTLKILDPACGSGAFLNQTLDFLIAEHKQTDDLLSDLTGEKIRIFDTDKTILENNIFGVDINEESVEIAKLSLWLRTARRGRLLSDLSGNIKCGNSLIDDPEVAGDKAFDWNVEFEEIMNRGGFDVVLGNPPYVRLQGLKASYEKESLFYERNYRAATSNYDIYVLFIEKSLALINPKGKAAFILPHKFLISEFGKGVRDLFVERRAVEGLVHFGSEMVFAEASTYTCILNLSEENDFVKFKHISPTQISSAFEFNSISYEKLNADKWNLNETQTAAVLEKLNRQPLRVKDVFAKIFQGIATSADDIYMIKGKQTGVYVAGYSKALAKTVTIESEFVKPILKGEDIAKYKNLDNQYFVLFPYHIENGKARPMTEEYIRNKYPLGYAYIKANETLLRHRERGRMDRDGWFLYIYPKSLTEFEQPKIITPDISLGSNMCFDEGKFYHGTTLYSFVKNDQFEEDYKFWLAIFNSKIMWFFIKNTSTELRGGYFRYKTKYLEPFPLPKPVVLSQQNVFVEKVNQIISLNKEVQTESTNFVKTLKEDKHLQKITKALENFNALSFEGFKAEVAKQKISFALGNENNNWREYFDTAKQKVNALQNQISQIDSQIDKMVYELYELTAEEIEIVENAASL